MCGCGSETGTGCPSESASQHSRKTSLPLVGKQRLQFVAKIGVFVPDEVLTLEGPQRGDKHKRWGSSGSGGFQTSDRQSHSHRD